MTSYIAEKHQTQEDPAEFSSDALNGKTQQIPSEQHHSSRTICAVDVVSEAPVIKGHVVTQRSTGCTQ